MDLEEALQSTEQSLSALEGAHGSRVAAHEGDAAELAEATRSLEQLAARLTEETAERVRLREENNMLRGRVRAMDKMGASTVAAVLGLDQEVAAPTMVSKSSLEAQVEQLADRVSELEHENASLTAISADYRDHASEKLLKFEAQVERLQSLLKEANENMAAGETERSLELRKELLALEELYTKDTTQLRVGLAGSLFLISLSLFQVKASLKKKKKNA